MHAPFRMHAGCSDIVGVLDQFLEGREAASSHLKRSCQSCLTKSRYECGRKPQYACWRWSDMAVSLWCVRESRVRNRRLSVSKRFRDRTVRLAVLFHSVRCRLCGGPSGLVQQPGSPGVSRPDSVSGAEADPGRFPGFRVSNQRLLMYALPFVLPRFRLRPALPLRL